MLYFVGFSSIALIANALPWLARKFKLKSKSPFLTSEAYALEMSNRIPSLLHALVVAPAALYALFTESGLARSTWASLMLDTDTLHKLADTQIYTRSPIAACIIPVSMAFFVHDTINYKKWDTSTPRYRELVMCHHGLCLLLWPASLQSGSGHWFLLHYLTYEVSTVWLHLRWFAKAGNQGMLDIGFSAAFVLSFIVSRTFTIPSLTLSILETFKFHKADPILCVCAYLGFVPMGLNFYWARCILNIAFEEVGALLNGKDKKLE